jgi:hypothetical protein
VSKGDNYTNDSRGLDRALKSSEEAAQAEHQRLAAIAAQKERRRKKKLLEGKVKLFRGSLQAVMDAQTMLAAVIEMLGKYGAVRPVGELLDPDEVVKASRESKDVDLVRLATRAASVQQKAEKELKSSFRFICDEAPQLRQSIQELAELKKLSDDYARELQAKGIESIVDLHLILTPDIDRLVRRFGPGGTGGDSGIFSAVKDLCGQIGSLLLPSIEQWHLQHCYFVMVDEVKKQAKKLRDEEAAAEAERQSRAIEDWFERVKPIRTGPPDKRDWSFIEKRYRTS